MHETHDEHDFCDLASILAGIPSQLDANQLPLEEEPGDGAETQRDWRRTHRYQPRKARDTHRSRRKAPTLENIR